MSSSLEEVLRAPVLPDNLPSFEIIKECERIKYHYNRDGRDEVAESDEEEDEEESEVEEVFPCECGYSDGNNSGELESQACGPAAKCINRELFIECNRGDCPCGDRCQNQRFQRRKYAPVKVIETPGKGFGLFVCEDLRPGALVMEYVGEVIDKEEMNRRARRYASERQPHFYFMTLRPDQIIDATKKGNLCRFMNHSCAPNCETQKWIVNGHIRIGLFAIKSIKAGSELTFDYKFVRFGKEPQKCLCGEPNCTGFIGVSKDTNESEGEPRRGKKSKSSVEADILEADDTFEDDFKAFIDSNPDSADKPSEVSLIATKLAQLSKDSDDASQISRLLDLLLATDKYLCLRKFLNLHGLKILFSLYQKDGSLKNKILRLLLKLPIVTAEAIESSGWMDVIKDSSEPEAQELKAKWQRNEIKEKGVIENQTISIIQVPSEFSSALQRKRPFVEEIGRTEKQIERHYGKVHDRSYDQYDKSQDRSQDRYYDKYDKSNYTHHSSPSRSRSNSPVKRRMIPDPKWLSATDPEGRVYYYHSVTRETSWSVPMIEERESYRERDRDNYRNRERERERDRNRDKDRDYRRDDDYRTNSRTNNGDKLNNSVLLEGIGDSAQLAAIIERAKLRRNQEEGDAHEGGVGVENGRISSSVLKEDDETGSPPLSADESRPKYYARLKEEVSSLVIRFFSHYRQELASEFKPLARKYTHKIIEKELSEGGPSGGEAFEMTSRKRNKIKAYLAQVITARKIKLIPEHESLTRTDK